MFNAAPIFVPLAMACASVLFGLSILYIVRLQDPSKSREIEEKKRSQIGREFIRIFFIEMFPLLCLVGSLSSYFSQWTGLWLFLWFIFVCLRIFFWASRK